MKHLLLIFFAATCSLISYAQNIKFEQMDSVKKADYLVKLAKEVVYNFGPDYYKEDLVAEISNTPEVYSSTFENPEVQKYVGKKYYTIILHEKKTKEKGKYIAKIGIWADDGEPYYVEFYDRIGTTFMLRPYKQWIKEGVKDEEKVHYEPKEGKAIH